MDDISSDIQALGSEEKEVREAALARIIKRTEPGVITALLAATNDKNPLVRRGVALALGTRGEPRAIPLLVPYLDDDDVEVALSALNALTCIGDPRATNPIIIALGNTNRDVRKRASEILKSRGITFGDAICDALEKKPGAIDYLVSLEDRRIIAPLLKARVSKHIETRWAAHEILSRLGEFAVETFIEALGSNNPKVRREVAGYLGKLGDERALKPLTKLLYEDVPDVKNAAVMAIGAIGNPNSFDDIVNALNNESTRVSAVEALGLMGGDRAIEVLLQLLEKDDTALRDVVVKTLGRLGDTRALEPLFEAEKKQKDKAFKDEIHNVIEQIVQANQSLEDIYEKTRCTRCFGHFAKHVLKYSFIKKYNYFACTECKGSHGRFDISEVVAVLDRKMKEETRQEAGKLYVNWFQRKRPFEFEKLYLIDVDDLEIEEFIRIAILENKMEEFKKKLPGIPVKISPSVNLSNKNVETIKKLIGRVEVVDPGI